MDTKRFKPLSLPLAEFEKREYLLYVTEDVNVDDLLAPDTWQHVAADMNPWDVIFVRWEDMSKECELRVMDVSNVSARVVLVGEVVEFDGVADLDETQDSLYVKYRGNAKWCVLRTNDDGVIASGLSNKLAAEAAKIEQLRSVG